MALFVESMANAVPCRHLEGLKINIRIFSLLLLKLFRILILGERRAHPP
jgi:hypothetical protein